jgi:Putative adhesin
MHKHTKTRLACLLFAAASAATAQANDRCKLSADRNLALDLAGAKTVVFDIGPHTLKLEGATGAGGRVRGKACASDAERLADLTITQRREGDKLIVRAERKEGLRKLSWSGNDYGDLTLSATVPNTLAVQVKVGSGEAHIEDVASLTGDVNSGELHASRVSGMFYADVGSGQIAANDVGGLHVVSVGSGDLIANGIGADTRVGEVGSGDLAIVGAKGNVSIGSIGSGDAKVENVDGDVVVDRIGSGDLDATGVRGGLTVQHVGSGSVRHRAIAGQLRIPDQH